MLRQRRRDGEAEREIEPLARRAGGALALGGVVGRDLDRVDAMLSRTLHAHLQQAVAHRAVDHRGEAVGLEAPPRTRSASTGPSRG